MARGNVHQSFVRWRFLVRAIEDSAANERLYEAMLQRDRYCCGFWVRPSRCHRAISTYSDRPISTKPSLRYNGAPSGVASR